MDQTSVAWVYDGAKPWAGVNGPVVDANDLLEYIVAAECGVWGAVCAGVCLLEAEAKG